MTDFVKSFVLLLLLLNPFLVIVYLVDVVQKSERKNFQRVLVQAGLIAGAVFCIFALLGDAIFSKFVQAEFASFQIFGGIVFLLVAVQFVFKGPDSISMLRGDAKNLAGAIAMPVLIGPGTISASVVIGERHEPLLACLAVLVAVFLCILTMILLKFAHDWLRPRREIFIERYIDVAGRITALFVGTISIEMIMQGVLAWAAKF